MEGNMKKTIIFLAALLGVASAKAELTETQKLDEARRELKIKQALQVLINEGVIDDSESQCLKVDPSLLDQLRAAGTVQPSNGPSTQSICVIVK